VEEKFWQLFMLAGEAQGDPARFTHGAYGLQLPAELHGADPVDLANRLQRHFVEGTRLGIPALLFAEGLHGLVQEGATVFPQALGLAASWDPELLGEVAGVVAGECRARGARQVLSPVVNLALDGRWGRVEESYGEDPFLSARLGAAFVQGFETRGVATCPKHFIANSGAGGRDSWPVGRDLRELRDLHLPPFQACLEAGASSVMTAYNSYDGRPCTASAFLQQEILRGELGFGGVILSDAGAVGGANVLHGTAADYGDATAQALRDGLDVVFQTSVDHEALFLPPFLDGRIPPAAVDSAVARVLRLKFRLGLFEHPYVEPGDGRPLRSPEALELARRAAEASVVLLRNEGGTLPFGPDVKRLALLGPEAAVARLGGYSAPCTRAVSLLEGLRRRLAGQVEVLHAAGCSREAREAVVVPDSVLSHDTGQGCRPGLRARWFANPEWAGEPLLDRVEPRVQGDWSLFTPDPRLAADQFSAIWEGWITAPVDGSIQLGVEGSEGWRLFLDDRLLLERSQPVSAGLATAPLEVRAGEPRRLRLEFREPAGGARLALVWSLGAESGDADLAAAVVLAARCDAVVVAAGIEEGEFRDRARLELPGRQEELIRKVAALGKPVAVLLTGGGPVDVGNWVEEVGALLAVGYPGERGGEALASVLWGDANPAGRLPLTWPLEAGQLPLTARHLPTGRGEDYHDLSGRARFPLGHGLSYTSFSYEDLRVEPRRIPPDGQARVTVTVRNTGSRTGDEVAQLYLRDELASLARPTRELAGFRRVRLEPGEAREVVFELGPRELGLWDVHGARVVEPGFFQLAVGASSRDLRLKGRLEVADRP